MKINNIEFYNNNINQCVSQYESLTFDMVHGELVKKEIKENSKILDVGCGTGRDAFYLANNGHMVTALDPSDEMLKYATQNNNHKNIKYVKSSLPNLENIDGKFDFILISAVWMHLDLEQQKKSLKILKSKLNKNAKILILVRHGKFSDGRTSHDFIEEESFDSIINDLKMNAKKISEPSSDLLKRGDVYWSKILIENKNIKKLKIKNG